MVWEKAKGEVGAVGILRRGSVWPEDPTLSLAFDMALGM